MKHADTFYLRYIYIFLKCIDEKMSTFLFQDTQILHESQLEDVCNILNKGEIPNLFQFEDKVKLMEEITNGTSINEKYNNISVKIICIL